MDSEELARLFQVVQSRKLDAVKSNKTGGDAAPIILEMCERSLRIGKTHRANMNVLQLAPTISPSCSLGYP